MFGLGMPELIMIMGVTFLVFGGKKLPELGAGLGKGIKAFKTGLRDGDSSATSLLEESVPGLQEMASVKNPVNELSQIGPAKS